MKKGFLKIAISTIVLGVALTSTAQAEIENDRVIAKINGEAVKISDLLAFAKQRNPSSDLKDPAIKQQVITAYVSRELLYQEALKQKLDKEDIVQVALKNQRREVISQALMARIVTKNPITDADLKKIYNEKIKAVSGNEFNVSHILTKTEAEAKQVIIRLNKGEKFTDVAIAVSTDSNAQTGGLIGWMHPSKLPENFSGLINTLKKTKPGNYAQHAVETEFGWHIIMINEARAVNPPPFESVRANVANLALEARIAEHIAELQKTAKIEIMN